MLEKMKMFKNRTQIKARVKINNEILRSREEIEGLWDMINAVTEVAAPFNLEAHRLATKRIDTLEARIIYLEAAKQLLK